MNKRKVNAMIPEAYEVLRNIGIVQNENGTEQINKSYSAQISSFGAAIVMGSLLPAISFFSGSGNNGQNNRGKIDRSKITEAIRQLVYKSEPEGELFDVVKKLIEEKKEIKGRLLAENEVKEEIVNAAIALKLAMNLYHLVEK